MNPTDLTWMLNDVLTVPEVRHALVLSSDGLMRGCSQGLTREAAERLAAAFSGLQSLSRRTAEFCGRGESPWRQSMVEFDDGFVFLIAAGPNAFLAVSTTNAVDMEAVTFQMHKLVDRLGQSLSAPPRQGPGSAA